MVAATVLDRAVFVRELLPQDLKVELDQLSGDEGRAWSRLPRHGRRSRAPPPARSRASAAWRAEMAAHRTKNIDAPSWLWQARRRARGGSRARLPRALPALRARGGSRLPSRPAPRRAWPDKRPNGRDVADPSNVRASAPRAPRRHASASAIRRGHSSARRSDGKTLSRYSSAVSRSAESSSWTPVARSAAARTGNASPSSVNTCSSISATRWFVDAADRRRARGAPPRRRSRWSPPRDSRHRRASTSDGAAPDTGPRTTD